MADIEKTIRYNKLLNIYQDLLSSTQRQFLNDYYVYDLSLSEIASMHSISRAAVEDGIKKGMKKLDDFESTLHVLEKNEYLLKITAKLKQKASNQEEIELIEELEKGI